MTDRYRVASYNVRVAMDDEPDAWEQRVGAVTGTIRQHRPDLIGIQEPLAEQFDDVRDRLPEYEWVGVGREDGDRAGEFVPIGLLRDRFSLEETDTFWLSETPDVVGSVGWNADLSRILTWGRIRDRTTGVRVLHANTHLSHVSEWARRESATLISDRLSELATDEAVVLTGDFNTEPGSPPYEILVGREGDGHLRDARNRSRHGHHGPEHTFTGFEDPRSGCRIDYVFASPDVKVTHHASCTDLRANDRVPSDHLPVVADVELP